ncbi:MAG: PadR family transcriptional regulator [Firmicutes bacterium]|nr:PadR family transcriptional regulator [Alicyclobacillaceae bacterium]MCL6496915.1 PadR family transcriptional regulator [Bacillota bacterium]
MAREGGQRRYQTGKHLEAFLLLLLQQRPDHGGALLSRLEALLPEQWTIDSGRVYRLLRELEAEGALTSEWVAEASGAPIRVYYMTPLGRMRLADWKEDIALRRDSMNRFLALWEELFGA